MIEIARRDVSGTMSDRAQRTVTEDARHADTPGDADGSTAVAAEDKRLADLLARVALADRDAFAELYRLLAPTVFGLLVRLVGSRDVAAEVQQEVFVHIWRSASGYRPHLGRARTWITTVARNRAIDRLRREDTQRRLYDRDVSIEISRAVSDDNPLRDAEDDQASARLADCLERLAQNQRHVVWLAYRYGHTRNEIARRLDAPVGTVKSWLHRGLKRLQGCLGR